MTCPNCDRGYQDPTVGIEFEADDGEPLGEARSTCVPRVGDEVSLDALRRVERVRWVHRTSTRGSWDHTLSAVVTLGPARPDREGT